MRLTDATVWLAMGALAALAGVGSDRAAAAQAAPPSNTAAADRSLLEQAISRLRSEYLRKQDAGEVDENQRDLLKELNTARNAGDWKRVGELLASKGLLPAAPAEAVDPIAGAETSPPAAPAAHAGTPRSGLDAPAAHVGTPRSGLDAPAAHVGTPRSGLDAPASDPYSTKPDAPSSAAQKFVREWTEIQSDGLKVALLVYKPVSPPAKSPAIVLAHSGFRTIPLAEQKLAEALVAVGYFVFMPEFRGRQRSGGSVEYIQGEVRDLIATLARVRTEQGVDASRLGLAGAGQGGAVVLKALSLQGIEGVTCVASISAPTDVEALIAESEPFRRDLKSNGVQYASWSRQAMYDRSPIYFSQHVNVPVLIIHGGRDKLVPWRFAESYKAVLEARKKTVKLFACPADDETLVASLSRYHVALQNFLAESLRPPGWKIQKPGQKGQPGAQGGSSGGQDAPSGRGGGRQRN
jgi:dienelactone hydrolase